MASDDDSFEYIFKSRIFISHNFPLRVSRRISMLKTRCSSITLYGSGPIAPYAHRRKHSADVRSGEPYVWIETGISFPPSFSQWSGEPHTTPAVGASIRSLHVFRESSGENGTDDAEDGA